MRAMKDKLAHLAERRAGLIAKAATQRTALAQNVESWRRPLLLADQGLAALRFVKRHPWWLGGCVVFITALRPGHIGVKLQRGWLAWQVMHKLLGKSP
jgi:hypothetical protein